MNKKINKLTVKDNKMELLTPEQQAQLRQLLPEWVVEFEEDGTSVLRWNYQFLLLVEELLRRDHGFSDKQLIKLEKRLKVAMPAFVGLSLKEAMILRPKDMESAMTMIDFHKKALKKERVSELPAGTIKKVKQLKKPEAEEDPLTLH